MPKEIKEKIIEILETRAVRYNKNLIADQILELIDQERQKWAEEVKLEKLEWHDRCLESQDWYDGYNQAIKELEALKQRIKKVGKT